MQKKWKTNAFSIFLNIILILFLAVYLFVPFLNYNWLAKIYSPFCSIKKIYQNNDYLPAWCLDSKSSEQEQENNTNINQPAINTNDSVKIANPAAVKCEEDGGTLEDYMTPAGSAALCVFGDGSVCNQWAYFRGECKRGECFKECQKINTSLEGWYISCTQELIELAKCGAEEENQNEKTSPETMPGSVQKSIKVTSPLSNEQLSSPFQVEGEAIVYQDKVYIRVKNSAGNALIEESVVAKHKPGTEWADFSISLNYEFSETKEGFIEVYSLDQNGREQNLISIPVKF